MRNILNIFRRPPGKPHDLSDAPAGRQNINRKTRAGIRSGIHADNRNSAGIDPAMRSRSRVPKTPHAQLFAAALGTVNVIDIYDRPTDTNKALLEDIKNLLHSMDAALSIFREDSEVSRVNRNAGKMPVRVSPETLDVIREGLRYGRLTAGAFDITAGPLSRLWKDAITNEALPSDWEIAASRMAIDYESVVIDEEHSTVFLKKRGASIDLGGIAKGYAADLIAEMCRKAGVHDALINLGGTVRLIGEGDGRDVGIQDPFGKTGESIGKLFLKDTAVVTSGTYERSFVQNGVCYHHIVDPHTGFPAKSSLVGVTLIGPDATELDALATTMFLLTPEQCITTLLHRNISAVLVTEDGGVVLTPDLQGSFIPDTERMNANNDNNRNYASTNANINTAETYTAAERSS